MHIKRCFQKLMRENLCIRRIRKNTGVWLLGVWFLRISDFKRCNRSDWLGEPPIEVPRGFCGFGDVRKSQLRFEFGEVLVAAKEDNRKIP